MSLQLHHQVGQIPPITNRESLSQSINCQILHHAGYQRRLPQCEDKGRRRMENNIYHQIRHLPILGHAFWAHQCASYIPKMNQQNLVVIYRDMFHSISGRYLYILEESGTTPKRRGCYHLSYPETPDTIPTVKMHVYST